MIRAVLVDDEEPARDRLRGMLASFDDVLVVGEAEDGEAALRFIDRTRPDLVFLDIQMPGRTGMEVAASLEPPRPKVIFCTAFDQYAIDAFEHHAVDYLLKPLKRDRLARALDRVRESMDDPERLRREMADASRTQSLLFPRTLAPIDNLDYSGACRVARGVGGDYYDYLSLGPGRLGITVGDVSGKGMFAGLLMAGLQARIQSLAPRHQSALDRLFEELNALICASIDANRYVTLFFGLYDGASRVLTYVNAGHDPPLLLRPGGGPGPPAFASRRLAASGTVIGVSPGVRYRQESLQLARGDILLAFTDGLTESMNEQGHEFGVAGVEALASRHAELPASRLRDRILEQADRFRGGAVQHDDVTLVVAKVT